MPLESPEGFIRHIVLSRTARAETYRSRPGRGPDRRLPQRQRESHGDVLRRQLESAWEEGRRVRGATAAVAVGAIDGVVLEFRGEPGFDLVFESLEFRPSGIELLTARLDGDIMVATVFIPEGKLGYFLRRIEKYLAAPQPRYRSLLDGISEIRAATIRSLWTDSVEFPQNDAATWWELWVRRGGDELETRVATVESRQLLQFDSRRLYFAERVVLLTRGTIQNLAQATELLDVVAELRLARQTPEPIMRMTGIQQQELLADLLARTTYADAAAPAVCLLDTGVNRAHQLLANALDPADMHSCDPAWGAHDHHGHGTSMAGLALYGDLVTLLNSDDPVVLPTRLESAKILPPMGENRPELYGNITIEAAARAEVEAPERRRALCLTATVADYRDLGQPTSWSAALDALSSGFYDERRRLAICAAGNTSLDSRINYPESNVVESIHDPAQAWNVLTVGAHTDRWLVQDTAFVGWTPLAPRGGLSPCSSTSRTWDPSWPLKPDIVLEGGNMVQSPDGLRADYTDGLQLLSTYFQPTVRPFTTTGDTSAAAAEAARMAATILSAYPDLRPETVRALLVHSAEWTPTMRDQFSPTLSRAELITLLRCCGFGVPDERRALWSLRNAVTLVAEDELQPFDKGAMNEMHVHPLPWPRDLLAGLGELPVELRVTLSYFVEPNPGRRGWVRKFRYMSHGLRFDVKTPEESLADFRKRINFALQADDDAASESGAKEWLLGPSLRNRGSIHSDRWRGTAARLAERGYIGVYPVMGWWRERRHLKRSERKARYSLIVSISTPEATVDVYTPIANLIQVGIQG